MCSRNRPALLQQAVGSVVAGATLPSEIVIIDQSDAPHPSLSTAENIRGCHIQYKWAHTLGVSKARNTASVVAAHDLLAWIDDDVLVSSEWLNALIEALNMEGPNTIVTGHVRPGTPEIEMGFAPSGIVNQERAVYLRRSFKDVLYSGNMALSRECLRVIGGFDERLGPGTRFHAAEDNDCGLRLLEAGYRIVYVPEALVYHRAWRNDYLSLRWRYGRGQGAFYAKYMTAYSRYGLKRLRSDMRKYLMRCYHRLRHERRAALGDLTYILGLLCGATEWSLRYRQTQCQRERYRVRSQLWSRFGKG